MSAILTDAGLVESSPLHLEDLQAALAYASELTQERYVALPQVPA